MAGVADRFLLDVANRKRLGADLTEAVLGIERGGSLETAQAFPSITVTIDDPRDRLMESSVLVRPAVRALGTAPAFTLRPIDVLLDGVWYRLRQASRSGDTVALKFNHRGVVYMAQHDTPLSASRNDETRAQFIRRQVLEAGRKRGAGHRLAFWAWELRKRMPIAPATEQTSMRSEPDRDAADTSERAKSGKGLTVKRAKMNAAQRSRAARIIKVQEELDAPAKARVAQFCAAIGESAIGEDTGARGTTFQTTQIPESDLEGQARAFLKGGRSFVAGGAIALAKKPGLTPGDIASQTEISDQGGAFYNKWKGEAEAILEVMGGAGGAGASGEAGSYTKPYRFRRPRGEDGWTNTGKLSEDVKKRRFVTIPVRGADLFVYAADVDLLRLRSQATIDLEAGYIIGRKEYDLDYGKTVRGMRLVVNGDPFDADFAWGLPVTLDGGPGGKWIVWEVHEVDGSGDVELDLRQPQPAGLEPRPETVQRADTSDSASSADDSATGKFVARGKSISDRNHPYVWGGGHARVGTPDGGTGRDPGIGFDCSGYIGACAYSAGMWPEAWGTSVPGSGTFASSWGEPGEGERLTVWANAGHVFAEVKIKGERVKYVDTSRQAGGKSGPHVRYGSRSTAGFTPRHWPGT